MLPAKIGIEFEIMSNLLVNLTQNNMTEQLPILLEKLETAIKNWWRYMFLVKWCKLLMWSSHLTTKDAGYTISYHELFSKDSGLMEAVKRKDNWDSLKSNVHMSRWDIEYDVSYYELKFHYMMMSLLTSEEKVLYFNENTIDD